MSAPSNFLGKAPAGAVANTQTSVYIAPATSLSWVEARIFVTNVTAGGVTLSCWIGGTTAAFLCGWGGVTLPAYSSDEIRIFLAPSEQIYLQAGASSSINYRVTLAEVL